jgi:hypothetical protein
LILDEENGLDECFFCLMRKIIMERTKRKMGD